ncbi:tail fiber protein [Sphingomonas canadensis]|uniref:Tail fiber protein n=1 Tax=Sphingomonas canadensis TaxID=1219257 RepID=A0ABW3H6E3_9SPHN|nr:tail fiber protein [Sphingomonas canadensis]MCW3836086.1 tail fiber protein [Sphingomonas canadensis]
MSVRRSKAMSLWLRHDPAAGGIVLDAAGWAPFDAVLAALKARGLAEDAGDVLDTVAQSDKQRFELSPDCTSIRARQGHSVAVDLDWPAAEPPHIPKRRPCFSPAPGGIVSLLNRREGKMINRKLKIAAAAAVAIGCSAPAIASADPYISEIRYLATNYCPEGTFEADGRILPIQQYQALFALIGNTYGGEMSKMTFALPDLRQSPALVTTPNGPKLKACIVYSGDWPHRPD